jgi:Protein of unknown function (DUF4079)
MKFLLLPLLLLPGTAAFAGVQQPRDRLRLRVPTRTYQPSVPLDGTELWAVENRGPDGIEDDESAVPQLSSEPSSLRKILPTVSTSVLTWMASAQGAVADSPDWGLFEGRTGSLLHPLMMGSLLLYSIYTGLLGFQWRRQRTIGDEIKALQKSLPDLQGAASVKEALAVAKGAEEPQVSRIAALESALPVEQQIKELQQERKSLVEAGPRDKHYSQGALLAFLGTAFAIEVRKQTAEATTGTPTIVLTPVAAFSTFFQGPLNTYARAGKLFPGPHLYAGAGLVVLWALAAACVPAMQKGSDTARTVHIGANLVGTGLFGWQVVSGIPILQKVIENTRWP